MTGLRDYLDEKRAAVEAVQAKPDEQTPISASVRVEGRSGVRRVRIRDHQVITDSGPHLAGYNLGPTAPELQLGALGSCLSHTFIIQAALRGIRLDAVEVEVSATISPRAGQTGPDEEPVIPRELTYIAHVESPASPDQLAELQEAVERACPLYLLLTTPHTIRGGIATGAGV
jgi:uncharacterized OsmC-like protein